MTRFVYLLMVLILLGGTLEPGSAQDTPTPPAVGINPVQVDGLVCRDQCLARTIELDLPALSRPPIRSLDMLLLMDVTGSMSDEFESVRSNIGAIVNALQGRVPDMRFGMAVYADYPDGNGDIPYELVAPFTTDLTSFRTQLDNMGILNGGDDPESLLRALTEVTRLDWLPDALHVIVLFTDAPPKEPDPGVDEQLGTQDDLDRNSTLTLLEEQAVKVISVQSDGDFAAREFLQLLAETTDGDYFALSNADEIPANVIRLVGLELDALSVGFVPQGGTFTFPANSDWFTQTPASIEYPENGGRFTVDVRICPQQAALVDGSYGLDLSLETGETVYGSVAATFDYFARCSNLIIQDNSEDQGESCSNPPFWDSPAIIVRNRADGGQVSEQPIAGSVNYIYLNILNRGPLDTTAEINITTVSEQVWTTLASQTATVVAGTTNQVGPFEWVPDSPVVSLRATISSVDDSLRDSQDVACDDNVAEAQRVWLRLDNPTLGGGENQLGGLLTYQPHQIRSPFSLRADLSDLAGSLTLLSSDSQRFTGDTRLAISAIPLDASGSLTFIATSRNLNSGIIPVSFEQDGNVYSGVNLYYEADPNARLRLRQLESSQPMNAAAPLDPSAILVGVLLVGLGIIISVLAAANLRRKTT
jgi:hypothetical protein